MGGGRIVGRVASLPQNTLKIRKKRILATSFSNLGGRPTRFSKVRGSGPPDPPPRWRRPWVHQRLDDASEAGWRLKGRRALQRLEGAEKARRRLRDWRRLRAWRALQRLKSASDVEGRLRGWMAPQKLQGASETGGTSDSKGRLRDCIGCIKGCRAPQKIEGISKAGRRLRGWSTPQSLEASQSLEGASEAGKCLRR